MTSRHAALLGVCLLFFAGSGSADGTDDGEAAAADTVMKIDHSTSIYPKRWCILTFIANSRSFRAQPASIHQSGPIDPFPLSGRVGMAGAADNSHLARDSFLGQVIEQRSLRFMTLWQDRSTALFLGINERGILGISLGEAVASAN